MNDWAVDGPPGPGPGPVGRLAEVAFDGPLVVTVTLRSASKRAVTLFAESMVTEQPLLPVHAPAHSTNAEPDAGVAVSMTVALRA